MTITEAERFQMHEALSTAHGKEVAAIIMEHPDAIVALGAIVAAELYDVALPVVVVSPQTLATYITGDSLSL